MKKKNSPSVSSSTDYSGKKRSQWAEIWGRLRKQPIAMICLGYLIVLVLVAIFADVIADYDEMAIKINAANKLLTPCKEHIFGCDNYGRDMFARIVHGSRTVLQVSVTAVLVAAVISVILACCATLFGGIVDMIIMRIIDIFTSIPSLIIAIAICAGLGSGTWQLILALMVTNITGLTRMIRSRTISIVQMEYIESARALGASVPHIILRHLLPNTLSILLVGVTGYVSTNIQMIATLGFVGLGIPSPRPEWGVMLNEGVTYMARAPHMVLIPGAAILLTCLATATFGDMLRDACDPQLKGRA
ncbi:MAG: ABC transporter permease [Lachnospiraceae bacterium]|nr:ABC transporter permease [Lachnospiraceae bacterium]